jgi:hypothetical protein
MVILHRLCRFRNSIFFRGRAVSPAPNPNLGAYTTASITLRVTGERKPPLHDKAAVLEEDITDQLWVFRIEGYIFLNISQISFMFSILIFPKIQGK